VWVVAVEATLSDAEIEQLSNQNKKWGTLLDGIYQLMAQGPDGERLLRLVVDSLRYQLYKSNEESKKSYDYAVSILKQLGEQGRLESEGFHEDTGSRSPITKREWQSRVIDTFENRLINPLSGTKTTYPWILDIEIKLENVRALANSQAPVAKVTEPSPGGSDEPTEADIDRCIKIYIHNCLKNDIRPVPDAGDFGHGCDLALKKKFGIPYAGIGRSRMRDRFYELMGELGYVRGPGRKNKTNIPKQRAKAEKLWPETLGL
jgi:hypothetical protein